MVIASPSGPRRDHLRVVDEHASVPVLLACATADAGDVEAASRSLGGEVVIEDGLERDPEVLRHAAQCAVSPTLFVVCQTAELSPELVRRAVESFGGRTAAGHRLLVLELVPSRAAGFAGTLRRARAQLGRARETGGMRDSSTLREVGGETHFDHALVRVEPRRGVARVAAAGDRTGPIPPHVRVHEPPRLSIVDDSAADTKHDGEVGSFVDLSPPEVVAPAARRPALDGATVRAIVIVVAVIVSTALVGLLA
jgi:hypothetical protein